MSVPAVTVTYGVDDDQFLDRDCESCKFEFKIHHDDWIAIVRDEELFCPSCDKVAPAADWRSSMQIAHSQAVAHAVLRKELNKGIGKLLRGSRSMRFTPSSEPAPPSEAPSRPVLATSQRCGGCGARYGAVGELRRCPSCGKASHV